MLNLSQLGHVDGGQRPVDNIVSSALNLSQLPLNLSQLPLNLSQLPLNLSQLSLYKYWKIQRNQESYPQEHLRTPRTPRTRGAFLKNRRSVLTESTPPS
jgi:hypothetical protein